MLLQLEKLKNKWFFSNSKSYFHHIVSLLFQCNQSLRAFKIPGSSCNKLCEWVHLKKLYFIVWGILKWKKTQVQSHRRKSGCDLNHWIENYNILLAAYPALKKINLLFYLGLNYVLKTWLFNFTVWTGKSKQCWRWKEWLFNDNTGNTKIHLQLLSPYIDAKRTQMNVYFSIRDNSCRQVYWFSTTM